jgi:hypothetical protein
LLLTAGHNAPDALTADVRPLISPPTNGRIDEANPLSTEGASFRIISDGKEYPATIWIKGVFDRSPEEFFTNVPESALKDLALVQTNESMAGRPSPLAPINETDPMPAGNYTFFIDRNGTTIQVNATIPQRNALGVCARYGVKRNGFGYCAVADQNIEFGDSGTGVFNEKGEVVGVLSGTDGQVIFIESVTEPSDFNKRLHELAALAPCYIKNPESIPDTVFTTVDFVDATSNADITSTGVKSFTAKVVGMRKGDSPSTVFVQTTIGDFQVFTDDSLLKACVDVNGQALQDNPRFKELSGLKNNNFQESLVVQLDTTQCLSANNPFRLRRKVLIGVLPATIKGSVYPIGRSVPAWGTFGGYEFTLNPVDTVLTTSSRIDLQPNQSKREDQKYADGTTSSITFNPRGKQGDVWYYDVQIRNNQHIQSVETIVNLNGRDYVLQIQLGEDVGTYNAVAGFNELTGQVVFGGGERLYLAALANRSYTAAATSEQPTQAEENWAP